jgi:hypothetical protein
VTDVPRCGSPVIVADVDSGPCARSRNHPGRCALFPWSDELDHDDALRVRLVEASERQAVELQRIADALQDDSGVTVGLRLTEILQALDFMNEPDE